MIPDNSQIEAALGGLSIESSSPSEGQTHVMLIEPRTSKEGEGEPLFLSFAGSEVKPNSLIKIVANALQDVGYDHSDDIAIAVLGVFAVSWNRDSSAVEYLRSLIDNSLNAKLHQELVLRTPIEDSYCLRIGEFEMKAFDPEKLRYWAKRGNSQIQSFLVDLDQMKGRLAISRQPLNLNIIDFNKLPSDSTPREPFIDNYFQAVFRFHCEERVGKIKDALLIYEAGGLLHFKSSLLVNPWKSTNIGLFTFKSSKQQSWSVCSKALMVCVNTPPSELLEECKQWLREELGHESLEKRPIDQTIRSYCRFLQRAYDHRHEDRPEESFLHFAIALDLLLGWKGSSASSVSSRSSVLTYSSANTDMESQIKRVNKLYDARSKYVHEGRIPEETALKEIEEICLCVLWCLLKVGASGEFQDVENWLNYIDLVTATEKAGECVTAEVLSKIGVQGERTPPNYVEYCGGPGATPMDLWRYRRRSSG